MRIKLLVSLIIIGLLVTVVSVLAAPAPDPLGAIPLYDSGWVLTTTLIWPSNYMVFEHNLNAYPTQWGIFAARDANGSYTDVVRRTAVTEIHLNDLWVPMPTVFACTFPCQENEDNYWAGEDYIRVLIFSASALGATPREVLYLPIIFHNY